jgi:hypothetical protein
MKKRIAVGVVLALLGSLAVAGIAGAQGPYNWNGGCGGGYCQGYQLGYGTGYGQGYFPGFNQPYYAVPNCYGGCGNYGNYGNYGYYGNCGNQCGCGGCGNYGYYGNYGNCGNQCGCGGCNNFGYYNHQDCNSGCNNYGFNPTGGTYSHDGGYYYYGAPADPPAGNQG